MNINDLLYRAFCDYTKNTKDDRDCENRRRASARAGANDALEIDRTECEIENDWIEAVEEGLEHIGRAIGEERQFIRSNGEVVPIEKVKSVSRESSEHLSRHGELITRRQGEEIVPDKLFTVERLNDYAVYENRFLYMLLCYLRDFLSYRYGRIAECANTYRGRLSIEKTIDTGSRHTVFSLRAEDVRKNDALTSEKSGVREKLARIEGSLKTVHLLLGTPLMQELAKVPVLKPPVTETNVLKMDKNFKGALRLYYFLVSYQKDGFTVKRNTLRFSPLSEGAARGFAEAEELLSFLMYMHGMQIEGELERAYAEEEERRKQEEKRRREERLEKLKEKAKASGKGDFEVMLNLEERCRALEREIVSRAESGARAQRLLAETEKKGAALETALQESRRSLEEEKRAHAEETAALEEKHAAAIAGIQEEQKEERRLLEEKHEADLLALKKESGERERALAEENARLQDQLKAAEEKCAAAERRKKEAESEIERLGKESTLDKARINALKSQCGGFAPEEDFTSMERFDELERQYRAFREFFKKEWRKAKKRIRQEEFAKAVPAKKNKGGKEDKSSGEL